MYYRCNGAYISVCWIFGKPIPATYYNICKCNGTMHFSMLVCKKADYCDFFYCDICKHNGPYIAVCCSEICSLRQIWRYVCNIAGNSVCFVSCSLHRTSVFNLLYPFMSKHRFASSVLARNMASRSFLDKPDELEGMLYRLT